MPTKNPQAGPARPGPRSRRDRPAKAPLSQEAIVEAALTVLGAEGAESVTMRRVAQELDTGPASLYVYVRNRKHLLDLVFDQVMAEVRAPETGTWRERLAGLMSRNVAALAARPGLALVCLGNIPSGPNAMAMSEQVMALLREGGLDDRTIAWAVDLLALVITATAAEASIFAGREAGGERLDEFVDRIRDGYSRLPAAHYPMIAGLWPLLTAGSGEERFSWWVDVLLNGLAVTPPPAIAPVND